ncbi:MAG TPA: thioredoxin-dependent thiol peroxidase [Anaerolineaceae bacterium]|nr:thioredoxin-dependent thiol peroxidase [Anaerolineaceae bacterium]
MPIQANIMAPDFTLPDENGSLTTLSSFRGKPVVLYFYPKDDTPGCTTEACSFRDDYSIYQEAGIVVLGISPDSVKSHTKFKNKYNLPFTLLADEGHKVCELYGVWGLKKAMGREYYGVFRTTFLIGPDGKLIKVFENVKPDGHSAQVFAALQRS